MNATYYFNQGESKELQAKDAGKDLVNLFDESGTLIVSGCPVSETAIDGHCVIGDGGSLDSENDDSNALTKEQIKERLTELNVDFDARSGIAKLQELLDEAETKQS